MKVNKSSLYSILFIVIILLQLYIVSYKISYFIQLITLFILCFDIKIIIKKYFILIFSGIGILIFLGFLGTIINNYHSLDIIKDFIFISKPLITFTLAYLIANAINNKENFIRTIIYLGIICALIHVFILIFLVGYKSIHQIRDYTKDNFIELFSLFFLIGYKKLFNKKFSNNNSITFFFIGLILFSNIFYFSRMTIIIAFILILSYYSLIRINKLNISILLGIILSIIGMFTILNNMHINRNGKGLEAFFFKIKNSPKEMFNTKIDINNHEQLWDHWRGYEAKRSFALMNQNPSSYIIGNGYGSLINLKILAPLSSDKKGLKYISHIHNGYVFTFYKLGTLGMIIYLLILIKIYLLGQLKNNFVATTISAIGIIYLLTTFTITGIFNTTDNIMFILGGLIFYFSNQTINKKDNEQSHIISNNY